MKVGIAGFAGSGKSTVFQWLTGAAPDPARSQQGQLGIATIPDERLDWLAQHFQPKKTTPAKLEFVDTPGLLATERRDNPRRLGIMRDAGGLLIVLNGFAGGDLAEEYRRFREEKLISDLEIVLARIDKLGEQLRKPRPLKQKEADQAELSLLKRIADLLEQGQEASQAGLKDDEEKLIRSFQLLTLKKQQVFVNLGEALIGTPLPTDLVKLVPRALSAPAKLELELEELAAEDRIAFMRDLGLSGFARGDVLRQIFTGMGYRVFFTVGEDECRAWPIPEGTTAVDGAGEIHSDLARGFVRAEVVSFDDFKICGSMKEAKNKGVYRLEGKNYIVNDGDIMHILHS